MGIPSGNTLDFVLGIMGRLAQAQIITWLSGGWAEELRGICPPRSHQDVDLLYPSPHFSHFDQWLAGVADLSVLTAKRFSHKRAFLCEQVMIEVILLEPTSKGGYVTNFFNRRYQLIWPQQTLSSLLVKDQVVPVASEEALRLYRQDHHYITQAHQMYRQEHI